MLRKVRKATGLSLVLIVSISLLFPAQAVAESWDRTEIALFATALTLDYIDYKQTENILDTRDFYESNQFLGRYPSRVHMRNYFIISAVGSYLIADKLKPKYRKAFLVGFILIESLCVNRNIKIGITF